MAMIEVHDGQGRVQRLPLSRDRPLMFGSNPKADVVIPGDRILPFHARLRWNAQKSSYRIEGFPDVDYLLVNGRKMLATQLKMGDEIEIGSHHVFVIHLDEDEIPIKKSSDEERTRVVAKPPAAGGKGSASRAKYTAEGASAFSMIMAAMDDPDELPKRRDASVMIKAAVEPAPEPKPKPTARGWKRLFLFFSPKTSAPDREEVFTSPLVFGLIVTFLVLVLVGFGLYGIIIRTSATRLFLQAREDLDVGDFRNAIARFDEFLAKNPEDVRVGEAKVHRAMANVRRYASASGASWSLALEAEKAMIDQVGAIPAFKDSSTELDEVVIKTGEALADRAKQGGDRRVLEEAESILPLHGQLTGSNAESLLKRSRFPEKIEAARAAVVKFETRTQAFAAMDAALKERSSAKVYEIRDRLVERYADQARDPQLVSRMTKANELIRKAVTLDNSGRPAETEPHPSLLGPPTTLVLRWSEAPPTAEATSGSFVYALSEGDVVGLDGAVGTPLWRTRVGEAPFPPLPIPGGTSILVFDALHQELVRLEGSTGALLWRQEIGERVSAAPLVLGNQVIQSAPSGRLYFIDLTTGALKGTMNLGLPLRNTAVANETGQSLFITADRDCLFVIQRDPLSCVSVEYLGHESGSIAVPPARVGRYLVIPENTHFDNGRWHVYVINEEGFKIKPVQEVPVLGWTWGTPSAVGSVIWSAGDRGALAAFAIGPYDEKNPFQEIAKTSPDNGPSAPAFTFTRSEREIWVSSARSGRYQLDPQTQKITTAWTLAAAGPALAPPQSAGNLLVLTHQNVEGAGTALWGVEPKGGKPVWRTILGSRWSAPTRVDAGAENVSTFSLEGLPISLSKEQLEHGGFVWTTVPGPGSFRLPAEPLARIDGEGWTVIVPALRTTRILVRIADGPFQDRELSAPVGAMPLAFQGGLLLPGDDGRVYLIDPKTGESLAEPFIPPFDRTRPTRWKGPVAIGTDAVAIVDEAGHVRKLGIVKDPRPRLVALVEGSLGKDIEADPAATKEAIVVLTSDKLLRSLSTRDLSSVGSWPLKAPLAIPMVSADDKVCVADSLGNVSVIGTDGQRLWERQIDKATLAGPPCFLSGSLWCLSREGELVSLAAGDGVILNRAKLGTSTRGGPFPLGNSLALPTGAGTIQLWNLSNTPPSNP